MADVVAEVVAGLGLTHAENVRGALAAGALRVAQQIDVIGPSAPLMRELRVTLQALAAPDEQQGEPDMVDVLRAKRALRRAAAGLPVDSQFAAIIDGLRDSSELPAHHSDFSRG